MQHKNVRRLVSAYQAGFEQNSSGCLRFKEHFGKISGRSAIKHTRIIKER